MRAETGMVMTHAVMRSRLTPQRTALRRLTAPTPIMLPLMTCVVETGIPKFCVTKSVMAPAACEQKPSTAVMRVILLPIVLIIFHPPDIVPMAIAVIQAMGIQTGAPVRLCEAESRTSVSGSSQWGSESNPYCAA